MKITKNISILFKFLITIREYVHLKTIRVVDRIFKMPFGFSADGEDIILRKYLSGIEDGFYIDIGAHYPIEGSNTFGFYLNGWSGICIDPLPGLNRRYDFWRPRDKFIRAGVSSDATQSLDFYYYKNITDNSTFSPERVDTLKSIYGRVPTSVHPTKTLTIESICNKYHVEDTIHLINIDVEGMELEIVEQIFSEGLSPWIMCIEEISKTAETVPQGEIYSILRENGYIFAARTFLTSIYVKKENIHMMPSPYVKELIL